MYVDIGNISGLFYNIDSCTGYIYMHKIVDSVQAGPISTIKLTSSWSSSWYVPNHHRSGLFYNIDSCCTGYIYMYICIIGLQTGLISTIKLTSSSSYVIIIISGLFYNIASCAGFQVPADCRQRARPVAAVGGRYLRDAGVVASAAPASRPQRGHQVLTESGEFGTFRFCKACSYRWVGLGRKPNFFLFSKAEPKSDLSLTYFL
jgi:hypothetical protein